VSGERPQPCRAAAVRRVDGIGQSTPRRALSCWIVSICTTCREKAKAFIRKPENAKPGEVSPAAKLARAAATVCVLCGILIVPTEAAEAQAGFAAGCSVMHHASQVIRVPVSGPDEPGDHDPLHTDGPELTRDGSAATSSVTAPTTRAAAWPLSVRTAGLPRHALLRQYPPGPVSLPAPPGPHAAPTHVVAQPQHPGPHGPSAGPGLAPR